MSITTTMRFARRGGRMVGRVAPEGAATNLILGATPLKRRVFAPAMGTTVVEPRAALMVQSWAKAVATQRQRVRRRWALIGL
jgi:hypothetical protein